MPTPADWAWAGWAKCCSAPSIEIDPSSGVYTPARIFIMVDLPAPFSPTMAWTSPARRSRSTPCSTWTPTNDFLIPCICRSSRSAIDRPRAQGRRVRHVDPGLGARRREHRGGDARGAQAVAEDRQAVGRLAGLDGGVGVGDEGVEAVVVALWMAGRKRPRARRRARQRTRVALDDRRVLAPADPQVLRLLLVEGQGLVGAVDLQREPVLAARGDLGDHGAADRTAVGLELQHHCVLRHAFGDRDVTFGIDAGDS